MGVREPGLSRTGEQCSCAPVVVPEHVFELLVRASRGDTEAGAVALDWCEENGFGRSVSLFSNACAPLSRMSLYRSA